VVEARAEVCQNPQQTACVIPADEEEEETAQQAEAVAAAPMYIALDDCVDEIEGAAPAGRTARAFYFMAAAHTTCAPPSPPTPPGMAPTPTPAHPPPPSTPPHPPPPDCLPRMTMDMANAELLHNNLGGKVSPNPDLTPTPTRILALTLTPNPRP